MKESEISKEIKKKLSLLENTGDIFWWERLNSGKIQTSKGAWIQMCRKGTSDFVCVIKNKDKNISLIFLEAKKTGKNTIDEDQKSFAKKVVRHKDIHYWIVNNTSCLVRNILNIANDRVEEIKLDI